MGKTLSKVHGRYKPIQTLTFPPALHA